MIYDFQNPNERQNAKEYLKKLLKQAETNITIVEIKKKQEQRTIKQNAYLHVVFSLFAINFGYTLSEAKHLLKSSCDFLVYEKKQRMFVKSTTDLNTKELREFIEWIRNVSAKQGFYIPTAEQYLTEQFRINKEIEQNKEFL